MSIIDRHFMNIRTRIEQTIPAQPCLLCGVSSRNGAWCGPCEAALPSLSASRCPVCALPTPNGATCGRCLRHAPQFDRTVAVFAYAFPLDKLVQALKYNEQLMLARLLANKLVQQVEILPDCIVAMPLHPARLRERGFNQSLELARQIARSLNVPLLSHACQRVRDTPPQSALPWKERGVNMRNAFNCTEDLSGKHIAVVDDVMTSGSSVNELASALRKAHAREISAWVIARTLPR